MRKCKSEFHTRIRETLLIIKSSSNLNRQLYANDTSRVRQYINFKSIQESAITNYILSCDSCSNAKFDLNKFLTMRTYKSEFDTKIHEALLIRKSSSNLNRQLYANDTSFLLNIF